MNTRLSLQASSECIIRSLSQDKEVARRLAQMGILPGSRLRVIRLCPLWGNLGGLSIDQGQYFSLRDEEV
ncbi:MAG: ferrous iron transport protein A [Methylococcales bacterium]|nr:ferrous iron transport protein A [Methylococcales bacterium]